MKGFVIKLFVINLLKIAFLHFIFNILIDFLVNSDDINPIRLVFYSITFGSSISLILLLYHKNQLRKLGENELTEYNVKLSRETTIYSSLDLSSLLKLLKSDKYFSEMKLSHRSNEIRLNSKLTWGLSLNNIEKIGSWGEIILIKLDRDNNQVYVSSSLAYKLQLFDFGKNLFNIRKIEKLILNY